MLQLKPKTKTDSWVVVIGTAASGTLNTILDVTSSANVTQFGAAGTGTIVNCLNILLRYGVKAMVIRVATGANNTETATNIIGTAGTAGMGLLSTVEGTTGRYPLAVVVPGFTDNGVVDALATNCASIGSLGIVDYIGTYANLNTARATSTGYGTKSQNVAICFPQVLNGATTEYLSSHLAGRIGTAYRVGNWGIAPTGRILSSISSISPSVTYDNVTTLNSAGVVSVEAFGSSSFRLRGYTNSLTPLTVNSQLMRVMIESVFTRLIRAYISSRIGKATNVQRARELAMELNNLLVYYAADSIIGTGNVTFDEPNSTFTSDTATLAYNVTLVLNGATTIINSITFTVS